MLRGSSKNVIDGSKSGRAVITVAIAELAKEVEQLATKVRRIVAVADTHRPARLPPRAKREPEVPRKIASSSTTCATQPADISQAEKVPLSPQATQTGMAGERSAPVEAVVADPEGSAENATAMHVLELYDRLGGFMRPPKSS
jgi:hypothetical protein